ncbi:MAG: Hpt domain-containing protein [Terracidiphilus sp.]|jgi:HPt (histidine-containing phosphotransfer) domain-containing protein
MSSDTPPNPEPPGLAEALNRLWRQFLPQMLERVTVLDCAIGPFAAGVLTEEQREEVYAAAHKLAGILGSFGLPQGTVLAREAEGIFSGSSEPNPVAAARVARIVRELRSLIQNRR